MDCGDFLSTTDAFQQRLLVRGETVSFLRGSCMLKKQMEISAAEGDW